MTKNITLKGGISYNRYRWVAEPGSCETCQALDGTEYEFADEAPDRPHPNCRCHVEPVLQPESGYEEVEKIYETRADINELREDISGLQAEINAVKTKVDELPEEATNESMKNQEQSPNQEMNKISQDIQDIKNNLENYSNKFEQEEADLGLSPQEIVQYQQGVKDIKKQVFDLQKWLYDFNEKIEKLKENIEKWALNTGINVAGSISGQNDARELWNFSSFGGAKGYIQENGQLLESIDEIKNEKIRTFIQDKLESQIGVRNSRGIAFHNESTIAQNVRKADKFRDFIGSQKNSLINDKELRDSSLEFNWRYNLNNDNITNNFNIYNALNFVDVINIHLDSDGNLLATIIDIYDFNEGDSNLVVKAARYYQEKGKIENYFTIIILKIPPSEWINY